jgi:membrane protein DedA with SNARE-associated domain
MDPSQIADFFSQYAYQPGFVYLFIVMFMTASSFGLPIPEEVTLVSAGFVAYMARNPDLFPPPSPDATSVNLTVLSIVCFVAVLGSDVVIYYIGKFFGQRIVKTDFFNRVIGPGPLEKVHNIFHKHSSIAPAIFRFTPGVRFPGHLTCGLTGIPLWKFLAVDGTAALLSVPTQVLLVAYYGKEILENIKEFKIVIGVLIAIAIIYLLVKRFLRKKENKAANDLQES